MTPNHKHYFHCYFLTIILLLLWIITSDMQMVLGNPWKGSSTSKGVMTHKLRIIVLKTQRRLLTTIYNHRWGISNMLLPPFPTFHQHLSTFLFLCLLFKFLLDLCVCAGTHVAVRGQLSGVGSLLLPVCGSWGLNSAHHLAWWLSVYTCWTISPVIHFNYIFFPDKVICFNVRKWGR